MAPVVQKSSPTRFIFYSKFEFFSLASRSGPPDNYFFGNFFCHFFSNLFWWFLLIIFLDNSFCQFILVIYLSKIIFFKTWWDFTLTLTLSIPDMQNSWFCPQHVPDTLKLTCVFTTFVWSAFKPFSLPIPVITSGEDSRTFDRRVSLLVCTAAHMSNVWVLSDKGRKRKQVGAPYRAFGRH
jgi:hypothetical protein